MKKLLVALIVFCFNLCLFAQAEPVVYNTKTKKIHAVWCQWAKKCTVNCITIDRAKAIQRGGVPCKVCNGGK